jgi:hypothetical protein
LFFPKGFAWPLAIIAGWAGVSFVAESFGFWRERKR